MTEAAEAGIHGEEMKYPSSYSDFYKEFVQGNMSIITGQAGKQIRRYWRVFILHTANKR